MDEEDVLYKEFDIHCERYYDRDTCDSYVKRLGVEFYEYNLWRKEYDPFDEKSPTFSEFKLDLDLKEKEELARKEAEL